MRKGPKEGPKGRARERQQMGREAAKRDARKWEAAEERREKMEREREREKMKFCPKKKRSRRPRCPSNPNRPPSRLFPPSEKLTRASRGFLSRWESGCLCGFCCVGGNGSGRGGTAGLCLCQAEC
jgi:hypothetical protein